MVENLRYYISNGRIMVKWNWLGDNNKIATCRLVKRLNGEEVDRVDDITMNVYWNERGGCSFPIPEVPVRVELKDDDMQIPLKANVWESTRYPLRVEYKIGSHQERTGVFGMRRRSVPDMSIRLSFPKTLEEDEIRLIEGWVISGYSVKRPDKRFFLPKPTARVINIPAFDITEEEARDKYKFEIVPEVAGTVFDRLFTMDDTMMQSRQVDHAAYSKTEPICFDHLAKREDSGFYKVVCPYCFAEYGYDKPVFRALAFEKGEDGFTQELDERYDAFCRGKIETDVNIRRGKVLEWSDSGDIRQVAYAGAPDEMVDYVPGAEQKDIVIMVVDRFGNRTSQKICPECHHNLPLTSGKYPNLFISMMGNTGSGKTVYMASMINMVCQGMLFPGYKFNCRVCQNLQSRTIQRMHRVLIEGQDSDDEFETIVKPGTMAGSAVWQASGVGVAQNGQMDFGGFSSPQDDLSLDFVDAGQTGQSTDGFNPFMVDAPIGDDAFALPPDDSFPDVPADPNQLDMSSLSIDGQIDNGFEVQLDFSTMDQMTDDTQRQDAKALPKATTKSYMEPCIYELIGVDPKTKEEIGFSLSFFDFPGEAIWHQDDPNAMMNANDRRLINTIDHAAGLIFLFDPSSIERVRKLTDERKSGFWRLTLAGKNESSLKTLLGQRPNHILNSFRKKFTNSITKIDIPVAMVISKSDAIRDWLKHVDPTMQNEDTFFLDESVYALDNERTGLSMDELRRASNAIVAFMSDQELELACNEMLEPQNCLWVCASATGVAPDDNGTLYQRHGVPVHLLDPVEWIIYRRMQIMEKQV